MIACSCAALFEQVPLDASTIPAGLRLTVTSSQEEYLHGEPVALNVALSNAGKETLDLVRPTFGYGIVTFLSEDGVNFMRYRMGIFGLRSGWHKRETLSSGERWTLELRILYRYDRHYNRHRLEGKEKQLVEQVLSPEDLRKIRALRGEGKAAQQRSGPFPDDPRLDAQVTFRYPKETAWEQVLKDLSKQSGVPLRMAPEIRFRGGIASLEVTKSLRTMMCMATASRAKWVREGEGYRLVPAPGPEEKRSAGSPSNDQ